MSCPKKIVADIINSCTKRARGLQPLAYWAYRSDCTFTYDENEITALVVKFLGSIDSVKYGLDAGHSVVEYENRVDGFKHIFSGVIADGNATLDLMDDIVVFVEENAGGWLCYGAEQGLWKETQTQMSLTDGGTVAFTFGSRADMDENYSSWTVSDTIIEATPLLSLMITAAIGDGTVTPQQVLIRVTSGKDVTVKLPDGTYVTATGEININWEGAAGAIYVYPPINEIPQLLGNIIV